MSRMTAGAGVIEVVGAPGTGKSTLASTLTRTRGTRIGPVLPAALRLVGLRALPSVLPAYATRPVREDGRRTLERMLRLVVISGRSPVDEPIVYDQGPAYTAARLRRIGAGAKPGGTWDRWWSTTLDRVAASLDLIVALDAPDAVLAERIEARSKDHAAKGVPPETRARVIEDMRAEIADTVADLVERGVQVVHLDARVSTEEMARRAWEAVTAASSERSVSPRGGDVRGGASAGVVVAVVGCDGSGKSLLARTLVEHLHDVPAEFIYFGSGDGPASFLRRPMKTARDRLLGGKSDPGRTVRARRRYPAAMNAARTVWALALAREKAGKLRRAERERRRGAVVICDRYPQDEVVGRNDGPLLGRWADSDSWWRRRLAEAERRPYREAARSGPDLVLRLGVDIPTASARRPELPLAYLAERIDLVGSLRFPGARCGVVELDGRRPAGDVFVDARSVIDGVRRRASASLPAAAREPIVGDG